VILIGHSVGGAVATDFCSSDKRCVKGINLDGGSVDKKILSIPFLYIQAGIGSYCEEECLQGRKLMEEITKESHTTIVRLPEIKHYNFTDIRTPEIYEKDLLSQKDGRAEINQAITTFLTR
jgi:hypothetical protein